ncbi:MAG: 6-bladed beta-propeller [Proteobacteria bacterium]|nr:6-bladed beta-propeller [Pseudomonadota bacterium]
MELGFISTLALDSKGRVYVFQRDDPPVQIFDPSGKYLGPLGRGRVADAHGIYIAGDDRVFLVDRDAHQVLIFTPEGKLARALGKRHAPRLRAPFNHPTDAAVAADGEIYVTDGYGNSAVHRFSASGKLIRSWGGPGNGPGQFSTPHAIWVDRRDRVLVVDRENHRVQLFDRAGAYLCEWRDFWLPMDIWEDDRGLIFVTDQVPRLSMLTPDGQLVGRCRPCLNLPHGVWGNAAGDIFIAEINPSRVSRLARIA